MMAMAARVARARIARSRHNTTHDPPSNAIVVEGRARDTEHDEELHWAEQRLHASATVADDHVERAQTDRGRDEGEEYAVEPVPRLRPARQGDQYHRQQGEQQFRGSK